MSNMSDDCADKVLDHIFKKATYTQPDIWVALSTADPTDDGSGQADPGANYARKSTTEADWNDSAARIIDNAAVITFITSNGAWGTITHFSLWDAVTAGNMIGHGVLTAQKVVGDTDIVRFSIGALTCSIPPTP